MMYIIIVCETFTTNPIYQLSGENDFIMYTVGESPTLVSLKLFFTSLLAQDLHWCH